MLVSTPLRSKLGNWQVIIMSMIEGDHQRAASYGYMTCGFLLYFLGDFNDIYT